MSKEALAKRELGEPEIHATHCPALSGGECECGFKKAVSVDWDGVQEVLDGVWRREMSADDGFDQLNELIQTTIQPHRKPSRQCQLRIAETAYTTTMAQLNQKTEPTPMQSANNAAKRL